MTDATKTVSDLDLIHAYGHACRHWVLTGEPSDARAMDAARAALA